MAKAMTSSGCPRSCRRPRRQLYEEHGIGKLKRGELARYKSDVEFDLMRKIKAALDPNDTMNPGRSSDVRPDADR